MIVYLPFGQMQNVECKMQNRGISFGNDLKLCRRHTTIMHYAFFILHWVIEDGPLNDYLPLFQINEQDGNIRRADAGDAACLSDGHGTDLR